jgi:hypothetical protein
MSAYVIERIDYPHMWICEAPPGAVFDVSYQMAKAKRFACLEDARHEILRLGLAGVWKARELGGSR